MADAAAAAGGIDVTDVIVEIGVVASTEAADVAGGIRLLPCQHPHLNSRMIVPRMILLRTVRMVARLDSNRGTRDWQSFAYATGSAQDYRRRGPNHGRRRPWRTPAPAHGS